MTKSTATGGAGTKKSGKGPSKKSAATAATGTATVERVPNPNIKEPAEQFHNAAVLADAGWRIMTPSIHGLPKPLASIVNGVFAMELYVKSLFSTVAFGVPAAGGHGYSLALSSEHGPGAVFRQLCDQATYKKLGDEVLRRYSLDPLHGVQPDLHALLDTYNDAFVNFRYVFEGNYTALLSFDEGTMFEVLNFLRATISDLESYQPQP